MQKIYLDNASTTFPKPPEVAEAMVRYLTQQGANINRGGYARAYEVEEQVFETRQLLCRLFNGPDARSVVFTKNVTESLNILLKGFLRPGDHVLVSGMEHNAVMRPLVQLEALGCAFTRVPCTETGELRTDLLASCLRPNTKAVVMTHASNVCGTVLPLAEVGAFCAAHGLKFFVDSAQTAGVLPLDMRAWHIDGLAFTGHKGLLGPPGIGGFILAEDLAARLTPLLAGGTGSMSHSEQMPPHMPDRFEPGTPNLPGILGLRAGLQFVQKTGTHRILAHELALTDAFLQGLQPLAAAGRLRLLGRPDCTGRTGVVSVLPLHDDPARVAFMLDNDYGIMTRVGLHCAPAAHKTLGSYPRGAVRFSFGWWNTENDAAAAVRAVKEICHGN